MNNTTQAGLGVSESETAFDSAVLILSGDPVFLAHYERAFTALGFVPACADSAEMARALLRVIDVAFIVVDDRRAKFSVRQVWKTARQLQGHAPVLAITEDAPACGRDVPAPAEIGYLRHPALPKEIIDALAARFAGTAA